MEKAKRNQITFVFMKNIHNFAALFITMKVV
jgi:hypothetical protein